MSQLRGTEGSVGCGVKTECTARCLHTWAPRWAGVEGSVSLSLRKPVWGETKGNLAEKAHLEGGGEVKYMNSGVKLSGSQSHTPHSLAV